MPLRVFISHAHEDKVLAAALQRLIFDVFPPGDAQNVKVDYSSDDAPAGGPAAGAEWLEWILETVKVADVCVVILSEHSVDAPWLTWEAGAVTGAALSTVSESKPAGGRVIPVAFGIAVDQIPAPLRHRRAVNGADPAEITRLLYRLHALSGSAAPFDKASVATRAHAFVDEVRLVIQAAMLKHSPRLRMPDRTPIHFLNCRSSQVVQPDDGSIANGVRLFCAKFTGDAHQQWRLVSVREGVYRITTSDSSKSWSVQNDVAKTKAPIMLWDYEGVESQHWRVRTNPGADSGLTTLRIFNAATDLCAMPSPDRGHLLLTNWESLLDQDWWLLVAPLMEFN